MIDLNARFKDEVGYNVVERFNKLEQQDTLENYIDDFEHLRAVMIQNDSVLPDAYMLDSFVAGLNPAVKPFVRAFKPKTITDVVKYSRLQEEVILQTTSKVSKPSLSSQKSVPYTPALSNTKPPLLPTLVSLLKQSSSIVNKNKQTPTKTFKHIPTDVRAEKIAKGLCYFCGQPYSREHKCQFRNTQLFTVEIKGDNQDNDHLEPFNHEDEMVKVGEPYISVNALSSGQAFHTMRVKGSVNGQPIHILVDSGNTHDLLDINFAEKLGCQVDVIPPQNITIADGNHLNCKHICKDFSWSMQGNTFSTNVMLIQLGSCDMVLGVQWLSKLGPICWDFKNLVMKFTLDGKDVILKGIPLQKLKVKQGALSPKMLNNATHLCLLHLKQVDHVQSTEQLQVPGTTSDVVTKDLEPPKQLKEKYKIIFENPVELPPKRGVFDHPIPLQPGVLPVNIRPYRYPLKQRDIIEQLIQEMLDRCIIQDSSSPFASPVVLAGKKDGTWRLCVDYRELNSKTVKNKFPIPVVEELIDELSSSTVFTKLDLRSGYHQLRVQEQDIYKIAFKTYTCHYKFLVMPFGLTNAFVSFQGWMNHVFKPLLQKCVLVFFDDILVYSKNLDEHWGQLNVVFELMKANGMYAKESK